jgi:hypothetical protein
MLSADDPYFHNRIPGCVKFGPGLCIRPELKALLVQLGERGRAPAGPRSPGEVRREGQRPLQTGS